MSTETNNAETMFESGNVWNMTVDRLLDNRFVPDTNQCSIALSIDDDQLYDEKSSEEGSCDEQLDDEQSSETPLDRFFGSTDLIQTLHSFLDIETLDSFGQACIMYFRHPGYTRNVEKQQLETILSPELIAVNQSTRAAKNFVLRNHNYIYEQNVDNCINGIEHPYHIPPQSRNRCVKFTDV